MYKRQAEEAPAPAPGFESMAVKAATWGSPPPESAAAAMGSSSVSAAKSSREEKSFLIFQQSFLSTGDVYKRQTYFGGEDGIKVGASTIDQQLVKNLTRDDDAGGLEGYLRKFREIWRAFRLDASYDKETILEAYLNTNSFFASACTPAVLSVKLMVLR